MQLCNWCFPEQCPQSTSLRICPCILSLVLNQSLITSCLQALQDYKLHYHTACSALHTYAGFLGLEEILQDLQGAVWDNH